MLKPLEVFLEGDDVGGADVWLGDSPRFLFCFRCSIGYVTWLLWYSLDSANFGSRLLLRVGFGYGFVAHILTEALVAVFRRFLERWQTENQGGILLRGRLEGADWCGSFLGHRLADFLGWILGGHFALALALPTYFGTW